MKTMRKIILICIILLSLLQGGVMSEVAENPVAGPGIVLTEKEVKNLERKANRPDIEAIRCLFAYYVFEDSNKALIWARKGAMLGDASLQYFVGLDLISRDKQKERAKGIVELEKAANQNYFLAQVELARCYQEGKGVRKDLRLSEKWYRRSAIQGDTIAMLELCRLMTSRAKVFTTLSEAYGWTFLMLKRTTSKWSQPFVNKIHGAQREIIKKAKGLGIDEKKIVSGAEAWAKKQDVNVPMTDPMNIPEPECKYFK